MIAGINDCKRAYCGEKSRALLLIACSLRGPLHSPGASPAGDWIFALGRGDSAVCHLAGISRSATPLRPHATGQPSENGGCESDPEHRAAIARGRDRYLE